VYRLYDLMMTVAAVLLFPYALIRGVRYGEVWQGIGERLSYFSAQRLLPLQGRPLYWVHAVSVGEVRACLPLLKELRRAEPEAVLALSCMTYTGKQIAREVPEADLCFFLPFDISWLVGRTLRLLRPKALLVVETEIWPNLVRQAHRLQVPLLLVNGRISDRSFPRYLAAKKLLAPLLGQFTRFCMQSRMDALRIIRLGASSDRVVVTGNMKFDLPSPDFSTEALERMREEFRLVPGRPVWVAGSTRQGEEELILTAFVQLLDQGHDLQLVLVPRYPERARTVAELVSASGLQGVLRSELSARQEGLSRHDVLVGDTLGEMLKFYACADVVFVGGSLVPIGGHNVLEACMLGKPVLFGPHTENNKQIISLLLEARGGVRVSAESLAGEVSGLIGDAQRRETMGRNGAALYAEHAGAARRTFVALADSPGVS